MSFTGIAKRDLTLYKGNTFGPIYFQIEVSNDTFIEDLQIKSEVRNLAVFTKDLILSFSPKIHKASSTILFFELFKSASQTSTLVPGVYDYDIKLITETKTTTFCRGKFRIVENITI